jgi:heme exporter protein B
MPITPATIYLAKLAFHFLALLGLQLVILPCFALLADVSWMANPGKLAAVVVLANLGFASIGTILGGMLCSLRQRSQMLMILLLPLVVPVALGAGAATTALADAQPDPEWLLGLQLLGLFAGLYAAAGALLFEYAMEE